MKRITLLVIFFACVAASVISAVWMLAAILAGSNRAWRLAIAFDQLINAATGGSEDETVSSRAHRAMLKQRPWGCVLCKVLDRIEKDHCAKSLGQ